MTLSLASAAPLAPSTLTGRGARVTTRGLCKTFGRTTVLHPTDLEIPAGEILVLLGPSGCGKTTLLRLIAGLEQGDGPGMIRFDDEDVSAIPVERRNVGMVFQHYALFPNMTVAENVAYGLKVRGISRAERDAETRRLLAVMGLEALADRHIAQVSGGQRQRIALARALAIKPRILLLDEPLAALDAVLRERLRIEIGQLLREFGITAVYVTHDQAEAMAIGDRIAVMEKGRIAQIGTPPRIYHQPATAFVAEFVGTMNRVAGAVVAGRLCIEGAATHLHLSVDGPDRTALLCFRPEAVRLMAGPAAIRARVVASTFFGATQRVVADITPGTSILIDLPSALHLAPGSLVDLDIAPQALIEFPCET